MLEALVASEGYYVDAEVAQDALRARRLFNAIDPESAFKIDLIIRNAAVLGVEDLWHELLATARGSGTP